MKIKTFEIACSGYSVVADWHEGSTDEILLVLPGYTSSRTRQKNITAAIVKQTGTSALVFDYSGHGDSPFQLRDTRPAQHLLEVIYVFDWLTAKYPKASISVTGSSYGGFLATHLTQYRAFKKLVLRVPAIYKPEAFYDLWAARLDHEDKYTIMINAYRTDKDALANNPMLLAAANYTGKTLIVVHDEDEMVPKDTTDAYIKAFNADSFVEPNFSHSIGRVGEDSWVTPERLQDYETKIADWLNKN